MEGIINFLEQYWGYTLVGGVTVGTVITFTITQIVTIFKSKAKDKLHEASVAENNKLREDLRTNEESYKTEIKRLNEQIKRQQEQQAKRDAYFEKLQEVIFQSISYLVIASKLPTQDKIALQNKFSKLASSKALEYTEVIQDEVKALEEEVKNTVIPDIVETVKSTAEETKSLLDKYMKEE